MNLEEVLENRNVDGEIYLCDVHKWVGMDVPLPRAREIRNKLMEIYRD